MKKLLLLLAFAISAQGQTVALCGTPDDPGSTGVSSLTVTCTPPTGALLAIFAVTGPSITQTISGGGNTFVSPSIGSLAMPNQVGGGGSGAYNIWYVASANAGSTTFTVTNSASSTFNSMTVVSVSGVSLALNCGNAGNASGVAHIGPCLTSSAGGDVIFSLANRYAAGGDTPEDADAGSTSCPGSVSVTTLFSSSGSGAAVIWFTGSTGSTNYYACWNSQSGGTNQDMFIVGFKKVASAVTANPSVFGIAVQ